MEIHKKSINDNNMVSIIRSSQRSLDINQEFSFKQFYKYLGPGFLVSIAYLDPGNRDLDAAVSAQYSLLWVLMISTFIGFLYQMLAQKLGTVTGQDMSNLIRKHYEKKLSYSIWLMAEVAIIGADIQEIIGSAIALKILFGLAIWAGIIITLLDTFLILLIQYYKFNKIEQIFAFLVCMMGICFFITLINSKPDVGAIFTGIFVPYVPQGSLPAMIGLIGCIIMPHNLYLHSSLVQSRKINRSNPYAVKRAIKYFNYESFLILFVSFFINLCVISTFANSKSKILFSKIILFNFILYNCLADLTIETAGVSFDSSFKYGKYIWGLGLLAAGQSSTLSGTMAGQFVMEGFIKLKISRFQRSMISRSVAIIPSMIVALLGNPETLNSSLNVLQAIQLPFAVVPLIKFSRSKELLGEHRLGDNLFHFLTFIAFIMISLNVYTIGSGLEWSYDNYAPYLFVLAVCLYFFFIIIVASQDIQYRNQTMASLSTEDGKLFIQKDLSDDDE